MFRKPLPTYHVVYGDEIEQVNWCGYDIEVRQLFSAYDTNRDQRTGLLITETSAQDLAKMTGKWAGDLYIKARTPKMGLWDLTMTKVRLTQVDIGCLWFHHDGISSIYIREKPGGGRRR